MITSLLIDRATAALILAVIAAILLPGCGQPDVMLPYRAQVEQVLPSITGLRITATAGMGGELEIVNETGAELALLDEQGTAYVKITSDGVFERRGDNWVKTKETNVYYCHDQRIRYTGPAPKERKETIVKAWELHGTVGEQGFTILGQTVYRP
jgi:hypothetical protein